MGERIRSFDWSETAIGPIENWPQSLRTILSVTLNSKFPMFLYWGPELNCFYNDAFRPSLGNQGKHPDSLGKPGSEFWAEAWHELQPVIADIKDGGESTWSEDQLIPIYRNGKVENVYWTYSYSPVFDESGAPGGVLVTCIETTQKVLSLARLEESADELSFAIEATELATWDVNPVTDKLKGNTRLKEWFGLGANEEVDLQIAVDVIAEEDKARVIEAIQIAYQYSSGGQYDIEYTIVNPLTKQERYVRAKGRAWFNQHKEVYRFNGTLQDITAKVVARKQLQESESRFRLFVQASNDSLYRMSPDWKQMLTLEGTDFLSFTDKPKTSWVEEYLPPEDQEKALKAIEEAIRTNSAFELEHRVIKADGNVGWTHSRAIPVLNNEGEIIEWFGAATDITEKRQAQVALQETNQMLFSSNQKLSHINADMDNFIYTASHDLRAPISNIEGLMIAVQRYLPEESRQSPMIEKLFGLVADSIERFKRTINDLTEITKVQREDSNEEVAKLDLPKIIQEVQLDLSPQIEQAKAGFKVDLQECFPINFSTKNARSIVYNLISNAVKYRSPDRPLLVQMLCYREGDYLVLQVQDNGLGMDLSDKSKIFAMFKRLHDHVEGTGVGLYIVKKIIENAGGKIDVESKVGQGTTFRVYFRKSINA